MLAAATAAAAVLLLVGSPGGVETAAPITPSLRCLPSLPRELRRVLLGDFSGRSVRLAGGPGSMCATKKLLKKCDKTGSVAMWQSVLTP